VATHLAARTELCGLIIRFSVSVFLERSPLPRDGFHKVVVHGVSIERHDTAAGCHAVVLSFTESAQAVLGSALRRKCSVLPKVRRLCWALRYAESARPTLSSRLLQRKCFCQVFLVPDASASPAGSHSSRKNGRASLTAID
jgi:hypothetical protein